MTSQKPPFRPTPRTCAELGVCQARATPCNGCMHWYKVPAKPEDAEAETAIDKIAHWAGVAGTGLVFALSLVSVAGVAGYFYAQWFA